MRMSNTESNIYKVLDIKLGTLVSGIYFNKLMMFAPNSDVLYDYISTLDNRKFDYKLLNQLTKIYLIFLDNNIDNMYKSTYDPYKNENKVRDYLCNKGLIYTKGFIE